MAGYARTALTAKLGIKGGMEVHAVGAPRPYAALLAPLPSGVKIASRLTSRADLVHLFMTDRAELERRLKRCRTTLKPTAAVWVSWSKKSSGVPTDITEDTIRDVALPLGFVDVKVCAVTDVWSGLKLVVRRARR